MKYPKVIVLILSYNGRHLLREAISSYLENEYPNFEITVIDNGSIDNTQRFVRENFSQVRLLRIDKNLGYSGGFNLGLEYAFGRNEADYALISNNDVRVDSKAIAELVSIAKTDKKIGFVTGKVYYYDRPNILQTVGKYEDPIRWNGDHVGNNEEDTGQYDKISERYFIDDIFTLVSRELYKMTGGYNTMFFLQAEEYDWQARAKRLGFKIIYTPYAKLWHRDSMTIGRDSTQKIYYDFRNPMLVILLHKDPQFFRRYFWYHLLKDVIRGSLVSLKQGRIGLASAKWGGFLSGIGWGIRNRRFTLRHFI